MFKVREMKKSKTKVELLLFIFGARLIFIAPSESLRIDNRVIDFEKASRDKVNIDVHIKDISSAADDNSVNELITYQPINQTSSGISDGRKEENLRLLEISLSNFGDADATFLHLITTLANDSCEEESSPALPAWKIDKRVSGGTFRVEINQAESFVGKALFLCIRDEKSGELQHLGANSAIHFER